MKLTTRILAAAMTAALVVPSISLAAAEADNHVCYKIKDSNAVSATATAQFGGFLNCDVQVKAQYMCIGRDRDGLDDARGGELGTTICYKVKCADTMGTLSSSTLDTQYGTHGVIELDVDRPRMVCLPVGTDF